MLIAPQSEFTDQILEEDIEMSGAFYTRSSGQQVALESMATPHLKSAHAKLAREFPSHPEIAPMAAEIEKRDAEYQATQAEQVAS